MNKLDERVEETDPKSRISLALDFDIDLLLDLSIRKGPLILGVSDDPSMLSEAVSGLETFLETG